MKDILNIRPEEVKVKELKDSMFKIVSCCVLAGLLIPVSLIAIHSGEVVWGGVLFVIMIVLAIHGDKVVRHVYKMYSSKKNIEECGK